MSEYDYRIITEGNDNKTLVIEKKPESDDFRVQILWGSQVQATIMIPKERMIK